MLDGGGGAAALDDYGALRDNKKIIARSLSLSQLPSYHVVLLRLVLLDCLFIVLLRHPHY